MEKVGAGAFKAVAPAGALFDIVLPITVTNGSVTGNATTVTIPHGSVESGTLTVTRTAGTTAHVIVDIAAFPRLPQNQYGYALVKSDNMPLVIVRGPNTAPVFSNGTTTTRSVAENTESGVNIGAPVSAKDADGDTLTYSLSGIDASTFSINSSSGQLQTRTALDYETKTSYSVTVVASDSYGGSGSITVTIIVTDVHENRVPVFTDGNRTTRSIAENTVSGQQIGSAVSATDGDNDTLTYTLSGTDAASFDIVSTSGQLQTKAALDYETKTSYSVTVSVSDGYGGSDNIAVTINVTDVHENRAPVFTDGANTTRTIAENTASGQHIGTPVTATDADGNTLAYTLSGTDAASFGIDRTTGQLKTKAPLDYETKTAYTVTVIVSDGILADTINVTINVTDMDENRTPVFTDGNSATRTVAENTTAGTNIGNAITATDLDNDTLTYTLGGTDASSFSIVSTSGQLQTRAALDYETKTSYAVTITVSDGKLTDTINITINITDIDETIPNRAPVFTEGSTTTRAVAENTAAGQHIGTAVAATDADGNTLAYTLSGTDAASFGIDRTTGQLKTKAPLDYETKKTYTVTITVSDGKLTDTINVTINITDIDETIPNRASVFTEGSTTTRAVAENTASGQNIGSAISATDADNDTLTYSLGGTDAASFSIVSTSGQLQTSAALDYETKTSYSVTITVSDGSLTDSITVTINVTDVNETPTNNAPEPEPKPESNLSIVVINNPGPAYRERYNPYFLVEVQVDEIPTQGHTVTFSIEPDDGNVSFAYGGPTRVTGSNGQSGVTLRIGDRASGTYTVTASSGTVSVSRTVTVGTVPSLSVSISSSASNAAPGDTVKFTATVTENNNPASGQALTFGIIRYTDTSTDIEFIPVAGTASLSSTSATTDSNGQASTSLTIGSSASGSYAVSATLNDGRLDVASVTVEASSPPVSSAPVFTEGSTTTRAVAENTAAGQHIGTAVAATDADGNTLAYTLSGTDAASFGIDRTTGQLKTKTPLDYETKTAYTVTVTVSDGTLTDTITVTINVTDVNETSTNNAPEFTEGTSATRSIAENTASGTNIGSAVAATDADNDTLTYSLGGTDAASFSIDTATGQLQTSAVLHYETKNSYSVTVSVSDGNGGSDSITVTINVTDVTVSVLGNSITTCSIIHKTGNVYDATIAGTVIASQSVRHLTVYGFVNGGTSIGSDSIGFLDAGETANFSITGTWTHDGSTSQECYVIMFYQAQSAPSAQPVPAKTVLLPNFPNPFNPETWIPYQLAKPAEVTLTIYNVRGVVVRTIALGHKASGLYTSRSRAIHWDGRNEIGEKVATGVYFYTLTTGDYSATRKMLIRK